MVGDTDLCNVVMDTDEHDRMSMLCIACEMVSMVAMVTNEQYYRELTHLWSCY